MKKFILGLILSVFLASSVMAGEVTSEPIQLRDNTGAAISAYAMTTGVAVNSQSIDVRDNIGFATLFVTENAGSGDVDIYAEYSADNTNWSKAYNSDMSGTITVQGNIVTQIGTVTARPIVFTPVMAPYMRIVFDPDANSTVTASLVINRDK